MVDRRGFFKEFMGQAGVIHGDIRGVESIPLNRLSELPEEIIEEIVPVFFPDRNWFVKGESLYLSDEQRDEEKPLRLSPVEIMALELFEERITLKLVSEQIADELGLQLTKVYAAIKSLFFLLATFRICHPLTSYPIDKLVAAKDRLQDG